MKAAFGILVLALGLGGCYHTSPQSRPRSPAQPPHGDHRATLDLNHGRKWVVPAPMMVHIRGMEKDVRDLENAATKDHAALAAAIRERLGQLVTKCTMEGKAHDELHKWLMPFLGLSEAYFKASDPDVREEKFREVQHALAVFNEYFE